MDCGGSLAARGWSCGFLGLLFPLLGVSFLGAPVAFLAFFVRGGCWPSSGARYWFLRLLAFCRWLLSRSGLGVSGWSLFPFSWGGRWFWPPPAPPGGCAVVLPGSGCRWFPRVLLLVVARVCSWFCLSGFFRVRA